MKKVQCVCQEKFACGTLAGAAAVLAVQRKCVCVCVFGEFSKRTIIVKCRQH